VYFAQAADTLPFRTDADGPYTEAELKVIEQKANEKAKGKETKDLEFPTWFQLVEGEFPPEGSGHVISGELIWQDHLERRFHLRVDRNDSQDRGVWDLALDAMMLPYGSIHFQGAFAALQDIPLGTHLHGLYYLVDPNDKEVPTAAAPYGRKTPEFDFRRCFRIEDDFSRDTREKRLWKVDAVDFSTNKLTATPLREGKPEGEAKRFDLLASTLFHEGKGFTTLASLKAGQTLLFNLTWVTLYGPGRVREIWLDEESRTLASARQLARHHDHIRERGLPGYVTAVDDVDESVTVTLFGNVDPALLKEVVKGEGALAVTRESLMTYDPVNDRKGGQVSLVETVPVVPGSAGLRYRIDCDLMLEGFRPKRIVTLYPSGWKVNALPREEQYFGRE